MIRRCVQVRLLIGIALLVAVTATPALESTSFRISDATFNSGGHSAPDQILSSERLRVSLDSIGDGASGHRSLSSVSFHADGGFVDAYAPPPEVVGVGWSDPTTLLWHPVKSAGVYTLRSGAIPTLGPSAPLGECLAPSIAATQAYIAPLPFPGDARFYLVTARSHVGEESAQGQGVDGAQRPAGQPCP